MRIAIGNMHVDLGAGRRGVDMGPSALHVAGLKTELEKLHHEVVEVFALTVPSQEMSDCGDAKARYLPQIAEVCSRLADRVEEILGQENFPVIVGGDHSVAIGTISGLARHWARRGRRVGVLWVDAHADMNTPETTLSGNIHGMPLAILLGHGPAELIRLAGSDPALRAENVCIIGARDLDIAERSFVQRTGVRVYTMSELDERGAAECVDEALVLACRGTAGVHLSFDLDGVDPQYAPGVGTPVEGGLTLREAFLICEKCASSGKLLGVEMVEVNPVYDIGNQTAKLAVRLISSALGSRIL